MAHVCDSCGTAAVNCLFARRKFDVGNHHQNVEQYYQMMLN
jgi:hypothetical protein